MQLNRGFVCTLFNNKEKLINNSIDELINEKTRIQNEIENCKNESLKSRQELEDLKSGFNSRANYRYGQAYLDYQEWITKEYPIRIQSINDKVSGKVNEYENRIAKIVNQIEMKKNSSLAQLLNRENINNAFQISLTNEMGDVEDFRDIKVSPYFDLLKYIISHGYLDESYSDYITYFYPNSLAIKDKVFLRSITDRKALPFNYSLDRLDQIIENLDEYDYSQKEVLNYDLLEYLILFDKQGYAAIIINQIQEERRYDFVAGYMVSGKKLAPMVVAINEIWNNFFHDALETNSLPNDV